MASFKEPSSADHCYAKLIEMFGETLDNELICEIGQTCQWNFSQCVEALLMRSDNVPSTSWKQETAPKPPMTYSQRFQMGLAGGSNVFSEPVANPAPADKNTHLDKLYYQISDGYKILVLMRGLPGSGKSTLARQLIQKASLDPAEHIISADDFFTDRWGKYNFDPSKLSEAHARCQNRVKELMTKGFAPIIVDNTNIKLWEMEAYCVNAVDHGYIVQILEPTTSWSKNPEECFRRNKHGVPFDTIQNMRKSYERIKNGQELLDTFHLPRRIQLQRRELPPIVKSPELEPEPSVIKSFSPIQDTDDIVVDSEEIVKPNPFENFNWKAHEKEVSLFWQENILTTGSEEDKSLTSKVSKLQSIPKPQRKKAGQTGDAETEESLCDKMLSALKDDKEKDTIDNKKLDHDAPTESTKILYQHRKGCPNENEAFAEVRQLFPTVCIKYLWDLFEKCQGDANWMMNIMLSGSMDTDNMPGADAEEDFQCNCDSTTWSESTPVEMETPSTSSTPKQSGKPLPQRQKKKPQKAVDPQAEQMKREIEERIRIGDEFYTENMKRVRDWKTKKKNPPAPEQSYVPDDADDDFDDDLVGGEDEDVFEFRLGSEFINQLEGLFNTNSDGLDFHKFRPNVFMKKSLAKQIYHLWVESMMYQLEEQKLDALKDDEEIARQINELDDMKRQQVEFSDVTQMASAMQAYVHNNDWANGGADLALKLKRQKLYEIFPNVNRGVIDETLRQNEDNYERVVETLKNVYEVNADERLLEQKNKLILAAKIETEKIPKQTAVLINKPLTTGDAKRGALKEFEENRNKAMHHYQFRQECYQKAQEANQKRNPEVAYYYLQIAKLHHHKLDHYNHLAANSIVNVHDLTHNNAEMIDLHYLLVQEAIPCLEVFLDSHIKRLRQHRLPYKQLSIITGRGLHSAAGIPTIKMNVANYLRKRGLRYVEENPGLLRVKIYPNSRTTE